MHYYMTINSLTGEILNASMQHDQREIIGNDVIEGSSDWFDLFVNNNSKTRMLVYNSVSDEVTIEDRPTVPYIIDKQLLVADSIDLITIDGLPEQCRAVIKTVGTFEINDGIFEFSINAPGEYQLILEATGYQNSIITITATTT